MNRGVRARVRVRVRERLKRGIWSFNPVAERPRTHTRTRTRLLIRSIRFLFALSVFLIFSAHIGSPDVWYDGPAGPYSLRVLIRPPKVVPGLAEIIVRVRGGAERVRVAPAHWDTGAEGAPAPDVAVPVRGDPELFSAQLWLMARGAYRIVVMVDGASGAGSTIVPVMATAEQRLAMPNALGLILLAGSAFLFVGLISLVGAAVRESVLPPGEEPGPLRRHRARLAMLIAAPVTVLLLFGGWRWWGAVDRAHREQLDRPWTATANVQTTSAGTRLLTLEITDSMWTLRNNEQMLRRYARRALLPDHGKLMHLFLIKDGDLSGFAHVHPVTQDSLRFAVSLPSLPSGAYRVFADIVHESGAVHTLVARTVIADSAAAPANGAVLPPDADDAGWSGPALGSLTHPATELTPDLTMRWSVPARVPAGQEVDLAVDVVDAQGAAATLEPYMGMAAHAVVQREDGSVFVHLHPMGTISLAAQQALSTTRDGAQARHAPLHVQSRITFPYAFPKPGRYRIWIQVQQNGRVLTGAHDITVVASN